MNNESENRDPDRLSAALWIVVRRYCAQIRRHPTVAIPSLVLPGIGNILIFYTPPLIIARVLGKFMGDRGPSLGELAPYVLIFGGVWLAGEAIWRVTGFLISRAEVRGLEELYVEAMDELLAKDLSFFHDNYVGSLTKRALSYARRFEDVFDVMSFQVVANLLPLGFVGFVLWKHSPWLIITLVGMLVITFVLIWPRIRSRRKLVDIREAASTRLAGHLADSISNAEAVRAFAREPEEARIHALNVEDYGYKTLRAWDYQNLRVDTITAPMYVLTNVLGLIIALSTTKAVGGGLQTVFITFSYYAGITRVMWEFSRIYRNLEGALTEAAQFTELLLDPPAVADAAETKLFTPAHYGIELSNVCFRYEPSQPLLFEKFSLEVPHGAKVGLVGFSGGGKTTITRLLLRFSDIESGAIFLGGQRIDEIPQSALRRSIAYVPQDPSMFHRSLADNIRIGRPDATDDDVRRAAELAHAAEFIETLPLGYETLVGERGVKLSGGQRQRLAIARAILKDAPVLILDEATSSLDSESEALIQEALWTLMATRTAIVIAHRLSTVKRMDQLVVLDRGRVVEKGSHHTLLAQGGVYASLWAHQSGGFLAGEGASRFEAATSTPST
ncbi:MAG: ABC transporter ATP-binding protein [Chloracidobacterium sp.]|nr:ABC transporter ATP-binding protein [Chloracidobacterium sp.]